MNTPRLLKRSATPSAIRSAIPAAILASSLAIAAHADVTGSAGGSAPQPTIQPSTGMNYMIRTVGDTSQLGEIGMFAGTFTPDGWLPVDGSTITIASQPGLFNVLGTTYGGDGQITFQLPNLIGRTPIGAGNAPGLSPRALGDVVGSDTVQLTVNNLPPDAHSLPGGGFTGITGSGTPYSNIQASLALNFQFPTVGIFPSRDGNGGSTNDSLLGTLRISASPIVPNGFVLAQGQILSIQQNTAIFALLGTTYGGNGQTNFALPDLRGRAPIGAGSVAPGLTPQILGESIGSESLTLSTAQLPAHTHTLPGGGTTGVQGNNLPQSNMQPTLALHYIIALDGIFPTRDSGGGTDLEPLLGQIELFAGDFAPGGFAFCDGQLLPIQQNTALFSLLGTTYGGNGQTNFALPNLDSSLAVDTGQTPGLQPWTLGETTGTESNTLTIAQMPAHDHTIPAPEPASLSLLAARRRLLAPQKIPSSANPMTRPSRSTPIPAASSLE